VVTENMVCFGKYLSISELQTHFAIDGKAARITMKDNKETITTVLNKETNLPMFTGMPGAVLATKTNELNICITEEANQNLTEAQKELIRWHFRLGHLNFRSVKLLLQSGALGRTRLQRAASNCPDPKCSSCQFGKACPMLYCFQQYELRVIRSID
jgi:GAG-pre-integrase domain